MSLQEKYFDILQKRTRVVRFSTELVNAVIELFKTPNGDMDTTEAKLFITQHTELLNFTAEQLREKFQEYAKFGWKKTDITAAMEKNRSFKLLCYKTEDLKDKVMVLKDLGYKPKQIISNVQILGCPSKDIKLKFMFANLFNISTKNISYYIQSLEKTYYRTCFLAETKPELFEDSNTLTEELLKSTNRFTSKYKVSNEDLKLNYRLTNVTIDKIEQHYAKLAEEKNLPIIDLTNEEKQESLKRSDLNIIRNYIKNYKNSKEK